MYRKRTRRRGLSLLETILATALTVVVMMLVAGAMSLHLRTVDVRRTGVEEAQLARAVLQMIADDVRSAVYVDPESFQPLVVDSDEGGGGRGRGKGPEDGGEQEGEEEAGEFDAGVDESTDGTGSTGGSSGSDDTAVIPQVRGLLGTTYELQIDVRRLPYPDKLPTKSQEAVGMSGEQTAMDLPTDVKTVEYYVHANGTRAATGSVMPGAVAGGNLDGSGLVRRSLNRAATNWVFEFSAYEILDLFSDKLASEVSALQFEYFDGFQWLPDWDTDLYEGLPVAVRIIVAIVSSDSDTDDTLTGGVYGTIQYDPADPSRTIDGGHVFSTVVRIPTAKPRDVTAVGTE